MYNGYHNGEIYLPGNRIGVLLLHGLSGTPQKLELLAKALSRSNFTVLAPCLSGHGTNPDDLLKTNHDQWLQEVNDSITRLKAICEKVYIVGDSLGGALGLVTSLSNPVSGIVTMATPIYYRRHRFWGLLLHTVGYVKSYYKKKSNGWYSYEKVPVSVLRDIYRFTDTKLKPAIPMVTVPIMVIQGKEDRVVNPDSAQYIFDHLVTSNKELIWVDEGRHSLATGEAREKVFEEIIQFLDHQSRLTNGSAH